MPTYTENGFYIDQLIMSEWEHDNIAITLPLENIWTITTTCDIVDYGHQSQHFNCKRCGAPNQIDVCEYCGSAAEE